MGTGSLGTIMGALISKNGGQIDLIDAYADHVDALNKTGATVTGKMQLTNIPVTAFMPDQLSGSYDLVFLLVKQNHTASALKALLPHLHQDSVVCTLQNGLPEEAVTGVLEAQRVLSGVVGWGASFIRPGVSELTSDIDRMRYEIAELDGRQTERIRKIADLLNLAGQCTIVSNLPGIRWSKLLQNATLSGMSAALGSTYAQVLDHDKACACAAYAAREILQIVKRQGIRLVDLVPGWSFMDLDFNSASELEAAKEWLRQYFKPHRSLKASMLQDMEKSRPSEIDYIVGVCSDWGRQLGIQTPVCDTMVEIVHSFEAGKIAFPSIGDVDRFKLPDL